MSVLGFFLLCDLFRVSWDRICRMELFEMIRRLGFGCLGGGGLFFFSLEYLVVFCFECLV